MQLSDFKLMLSISDDKSDSLLNLIIRNTQLALKFKLSLGQNDELPSELDYIVLEVCVRRYNRLKNEGMSSYSQEGESITFKSDDFDDFLSDIEDWKRRNKSDGVLTLIDPYKRYDI